MERPTAQRKLEPLLSGTFLIRQRLVENHSGQMAQYALSIKWAQPWSLCPVSAPHTPHAYVSFVSFRFGSNVKHIKVNRAPENLYYIADCKKFRSIPVSVFWACLFWFDGSSPFALIVVPSGEFFFQELVDFYQRNTLEESFPELQTCLTLPYKDALRTGDSVIL